jgi:UDP-N-acetylglucosamine 2-epimerase
MLQLLLRGSIELFRAVKIHRVSNVMIDSSVRLLRSAKRYKANGLPRQYAPVILHRRSNVDKDESLQSILRCLAVNQRLDLIFPVHPQTRQRNDEFGIDVSGLQLLDPVLNKAQHRLYGMGEKNRCYCESYVAMQSTTTTTFRQSILRRSSELGQLEVVCERLAPSRRQLTYA